MNSNYYTFYERVFYLKSFGFIFVWYMFTLGWTGGIVCKSAKIDLRQSDAYSMYYVGISGVREWIEGIKWNALHMLFAKGKVTHTHTHAHKCSLNFDIRCLICVAWLILLGIRFLLSRKQCLLFIPNVLFKHHYKQLWRESIFALSQTMPPVHPSLNTYPTKNGTKWFGIKRSFIRYIIIYCS